MRVTWGTVCAAVLLMLHACKPENTIADMLRETHQKLEGRWQLEKRQVEIFDPYPTRISGTVLMGTTDDFYHFKEQDVISVGEAGKPVIEAHAKIYVKQVLMLSIGRNWAIDSLNSKRLVLSWLGRNDDSTNKTLHETLYFTR